MSDKKLTPFDFLNSINSKTNTDLDTSQYTAFMVNRGLSYFKDTVYWANEMNMHPELDKDQQYEFLLGAVRKGKRFSKWAKAEDDANTQLVMEFYKVNRRRAAEILSLLNNEQLGIITDKLSKGGR